MMNIEAQIFHYRLDKDGFKVLIFDLDQTSTLMHSGGALLGSKIVEYCEKAVPDFIIAATQWVRSGNKFAIASFTDTLAAERSTTYHREPHYGGKNLIKRFVDQVLPTDVASKVYMVGYFPIMHDNHPQEFDKRSKNYHMDMISKYFEIPLNRCVLFDDSMSNVENAKGYKAYIVDSTKGFQFSDYRP